MKDIVLDIVLVLMVGGVMILSATVIYWGFADKFKWISSSFATVWSWTSAILILLLAVFGDLPSDLTAAAKLSLGHYFGMFIGYALGAIIIAYPISWVVIGLGKFQDKFEPKDDD